jgi:putative ABC transport system permease protein
MMMAKDFDRFRTVPLALFLACLAMGAVVMAHVGLLSALRRASEIAVHRAEGATRRDVAVQFLAEGGVLSLLGALVGWGVGCGLAELRVRLEPTAGVRWAFPWNEAWVALAVSVVVGVLACVMPARRAAGMSPAEALSDE